MSLLSSCLPNDHSNQEQKVMMVFVKKQIEKLLEKQHGQQQCEELDIILSCEKSKSEIVKVILQTLESFGLNETAAALEAESGIELECQPMKKFKVLMQKKQWKKAADICEKLPFQDISSVKKSKFLLFRHAYFECLIKKQTGQAVLLLQNELKLYAPSNQELRELSTLVILSTPGELIEIFHRMIPNQFALKQKQISNSTDLMTKESIDQLLALKIVHQSSTYIIQLIQDLLNIKYTIPPPKLLQKIVKEAKSYEMLRCPIHSSLSEGFSIANTHICQARGYPNKLASLKRRHKDEVLHAKFSPNGLLAVTICKKSSIVLWKLTQKTTIKHQQLPENNTEKDQKDDSAYRKPFKVKLQFIARYKMEDKSLVWSLAWNDKGDKIAISQENSTISVFSIIQNTPNFAESSINIALVAVHVDSNIKSQNLAFIPNTTTVLYSIDSESLYLWDYVSEEVDLMVCWNTILFLHLLPNTQDLICVSPHGPITTINLSAKEEVLFFTERNEIASSILSSDGNHLLLNTISPNFLKLWNLSNRKLENIFQGYQQTNYFPQPQMKDNFIAIGGEDGKIMIWHKFHSDHPICIIDMSKMPKVRIYPKQIQFPNIEQKQNLKKTTKELIQTQNIQPQTPLSQNHEKVSAVKQIQFNPVFPGILLTGSEDGSVCLFISRDYEYNLGNLSAQMIKSKVDIEEVKKLENEVNISPNKKNRRAKENIAANTKSTLNDFNQTIQPENEKEEEPRLIKQLKKDQSQELLIGESKCQTNNTNISKPFQQQEEEQSDQESEEKQVKEQQIGQDNEDQEYEEEEFDEEEENENLINEETNKKHD